MAQRNPKSSSKPKLTEREFDRITKVWTLIIPVLVALISSGTSIAIAILSLNKSTPKNLSSAGLEAIDTAFQVIPSAGEDMTSSGGTFFDITEWRVVKIPIDSLEYQRFVDSVFVPGRTIILPEENLWTASEGKWSIMSKKVLSDSLSHSIRIQRGWRLIASPFKIPDSTSTRGLRFWHWFSMMDTTKLTPDSTMSGNTETTSPFVVYPLVMIVFISMFFTTRYLGKLYLRKTYSIEQ